MKIRRGDILYADLGGQYQGSMQRGMRPVVVDEETLARITEAVQVQVGVYDKYNG